MIRINLLPHREEKRKARRQQFFALGGLVSVLAALIIFLGFSIIGGYIGTQQAKNDFLKSEIAVLDKQISQIKGLQEQIRLLLSRKQVIENLQRDRAEPVRILGEMVRQLPDGVYLKSLKQQGTTVSISGYAQSNARVSTLMRNIEDSPYLERPVLIETKSAVVSSKRLQEFSMTLGVTRAKPEDLKPAPAAPGKKS